MYKLNVKVSGKDWIIIFLICDIEKDYEKGWMVI